jgi:hypothetical protein
MSGTLCKSFNAGELYMSAFSKWFKANGLKTDFYGNYTTTFRDCWDAAIKHVDALKPSHNTGSQPCFNVDCPALWFDHQCTSSKCSECSARVETQQASA